MDQIPSKVTLIIKRFIDELEKNNIPIKEAILFGSYATGNYHDWSDINLALVSDAFEGERFRDRNKIRRIKLELAVILNHYPTVRKILQWMTLLFKELSKLECGLSDRQRIIALKTIQRGATIHYSSFHLHFFIFFTSLR